MSGKTRRDEIVAAADQLFYRNGYEHTSFAQIAGMVKISRGNFYYHFKTKDEILDAVIRLRLANTRTLLERWETEDESPAERIRSFIDILIMNRAKIKRFGCPVGTLCTELAKLDHPAQADANQLFSLFRDWLTRQFKQLGRTRDADRLAMHLLACSQGIATLASAFNDEKFIKQEVNQLHSWLDRYIGSVAQP